MTTTPAGVLAAALAGLVLVAVGAALRPRPHRRATQTMVSRDSQSARSMRRGRRRERLLDHVFPDALDLFVVAVQAGHLPLDALRLLAPDVHPAVGAAFADVCRRVDRGERFADALAALSDALGTRALTFVATIALTERTGLPLGPVVDRLADDARQHRRRLAEIEARELPVRLAFPLVLCTLPSFVLVAIAPLLIGALSSLGPR